MTKKPMNENRLKAVSLSTVGSAFQRKWLHMLACVLIGAALAFALAWSSGTYRYTAQVKLDVPAEVLPEAVSADAAMEKAAAVLGISKTSARKEAISIDAAERIYTVKVAAKTPVQAQEAAKRYAAAVLEQQPTISLVQAAQLPERPTTSVWKRWSMIGAGCGFGIGIIIHILIEMFCLRIKNRRELELCIGLPDTANVPFLTNTEMGDEDIQDIAEWITEARQSGSVIFVGAAKNSGTSFITAKTAVKLAEMGNQVLLLDADLEAGERPECYPASDNQNGLAQFLRGECGIGSILAETETKDLTLIRAGAEMEEEMTDAHIEKVGKVIRVVAEYFDYVLVDAPNYEQYQDGVDLAAYCDGAMLVLTRNRIKPKDCRELAKELAALEKTELIGAIINRSRK
ncbi:MAG: hypothetical protein PUH12_05015 [Lachnospiraceae bacterium]|nr:hypothetical protein [Lachnospiraceae bacterium]